MKRHTSARTRREPEDSPLVKERKYFGFHACMAVFKHRRLDIIRAYVTNERLPQCSALLSWCAKTKRAYHVVGDEQIGKIAGSAHHEGVCILARAPKEPDDTETVKSLLKKKSCCVLYLDGVQNPHNVGSLLRSAAHFGVPVVLGASGKLPPVSGALCRVAQGAAEAVPLVPLAKPPEALAALQKAGFRVIGTSSGGGAPLQRFSFPRKAVLVLGSEGEGMSDELSALCDATVSISGSGAVESLNVAVAGGILLAESLRQRRQRKT